MDTGGSDSSCKDGHHDCCLITGFKCDLVGGGDGARGGGWNCSGCVGRDRVFVMVVIGCGIRVVPVVVPAFAMVAVLIVEGGL